MFDEIRELSDPCNWTQLKRFIAQKGSKGIVKSVCVCVCVCETSVVQP